VLARAQAVESLRDLVRREAFVMAYADCFFVMGVVMLVSIFALLLVPKPPPSGPAA